MFWSHVVLHALPYKRVLSHVLQNKSPNEHLYGTSPDLSTLWALGSLSYLLYSTLQSHGSKFSTQARKGTFSGLKDDTRICPSGYSHKGNLDLM